MTTKRVLHQFIGHEQEIYSLDISSDSRYIVSGSIDRSIRLWCTEENQCISVLRVESGVASVAISPDGRFVAAGDLNNSIRIWEIQSRTMVEHFESEQGHQNSIRSIAFSSDGQTLVSCSLDNTIKIWIFDNANVHLLNGSLLRRSKCVRTLKGHRDFVLDIAETFDGRWVISGSKDTNVQFWDSATGAAQFTLKGHTNAGESHLKRCEKISANSCRSHFSRLVTSHFPVCNRSGRLKG